MRGLPSPSLCGKPVSVGRDVDGSCPRRHECRKLTMDIALEKEREKKKSSLDEN